jgi:hypothetical protein
VGFDGQSKKKDLDNRGKRHIGQGVEEIHGVWQSQEGKVKIE